MVKINKIIKLLLCITIFLLFSSSTIGLASEPSRDITIIKKKELSNQPNVKSNSMVLHRENSNMVSEKAKKKQKIVVLNYHCINDKIYGVKDLFVTPKEFEKQMKYLKDKKYSVISLDEIGLDNKIVKPVVITFDDGYENNYTHAYPILKKYGFKATIFIITDLLERPLYLKKSQIKVSSDVFSFQSHTMSHKKLTELSDEKLKNQLEESKKRIEDITHQDVFALAFPYGKYNDNVLKEVKKYYSMSFTVNYGYLVETSDNYEIPRIGIGPNDTISVFKKKLTEANKQNPT